MQGSIVDTNDMSDGDKLEANLLWDTTGNFPPRVKLASTDIRLSYLRFWGEAKQYRALRS